jgi:hypothetical protein
MAQTIKLKRSALEGVIPTTSQLELGEVAINTYDGKMYIKKNVGGTETIVQVGGDSGTLEGVWKQYSYTATSGQTTFSGADSNSATLSYIPEFIEVFLNGVLLDPAVDFTAVTGSSVVLTSAASLNDLIQINAFAKVLGNGDIVVDAFTGDGTTSTYTLSTAPTVKENINVFIDGVYQENNSYSVSGTTLTLSENLPNASTMDVVIGSNNITLGEIQDLNIPGSITSVDSIQFDTSATTDPIAVGQLAWSSDYETLELGLSSNVQLELGEQTYVNVKAAETIAIGSVVYASGAVGNSGKIEVSNFIADGSIEERRVVGIAAETITSGNFGYIITFGNLRGLSTDGSTLTTPETWLLGDILYASSTVAGELTKNIPAAPNLAIAIAFITSAHASNGSLMVRAYDLGYHIDELHDVEITSVADNDILQWNNSTSRWENSAGTTTNITEGTNLYWTTARGNSNFTTNLAASDTDDLSEGATNLYYTSARANSDFDTRLATKTTADLSEGTNLYYTDTRVGSYLTTNSYATQGYVTTAVSNLVDSAPATLDTLNELAAALGDDPNFATTVSNSIGTKWTQDNTKISNWDTAYSWGNHASAGYLTGNQTITLTGDVSGSGTTSISVTVADDSHNHIISNVDGLQTALDGKLSTSGKAASLNVPDTRAVNDQPQNKLSKAISADFKSNTSVSNPPVNASNAYSHIITVAGWSTNEGSGGWPTQLSVGTGGIAYRQASSATVWGGWSKMFHDGYHPNADTWTTARTITLGGDLSGSVSINGGSDVTLTATVADDSHNHIISNVDGLQTALDGKVATTGDQTISGIKTFTNLIATNPTINSSGSSNNDSVMQWRYGTFDAYRLRLKQTVTSGVVRWNFSQTNNSINYEDVLVLDRGNVGIATTNPSEKLDVAGNVNASTGYKVNATTVIDASRNLTNIGTISSGGITSSGTSYFDNVRLTDSSRMGFGTAKAGATVGHTALVEEGVFWHTTSDYGIYRTAGSWSAPDYDQLRIKWVTGIELDGGNQYGKSGVNIINSDLKMGGTTVIDASRNLTNIGSGSFSGAVTSLGSVITGGEGTYNAPNFGSSNLGAINIRMPTNNRRNAITFSSAGASNAQAGIYVHQDNTAGTRMHLATTNSYATGPQARLTVQNNGNVGISTTAPSEKLHVVGNILASGNVTAYSDERLKDNIETLDGSKVLEMRGVSFTKDDEIGSGVIAQELEKIAPELVHTADDEMGTKSVAYGNLVGYLIEAVKLQQTQIDELKAQIEEMKNGD